MNVKVESESGERSNGHLVGKSFGVDHINHWAHRGGRIPSWEERLNSQIWIQTLKPKMEKLSEETEEEVYDCGLRSCSPILSRRGSSQPGVHSMWESKKVRIFTSGKACTWLNINGMTNNITIIMITTMIIDCDNHHLNHHRHDNLCRPKQSCSDQAFSLFSSHYFHLVVRVFITMMMIWWWLFHLCSNNDDDYDGKTFSSTLRCSIPHPTWRSIHHNPIQL